MVYDLRAILELMQVIAEPFRPRVAPRGPVMVGKSVEGAATPQTAAVEVDRLSRRFGTFQALDEVSLTVKEGEFFSLLGPSGCGKTTLLRIIGGLDLADSGVLRIGGIDAREIPAHKRPVNTVFQSYALFPHLSVRDNVAFGLRMKHVAESEVATRVEAALGMVQIAQFADRKPAQLSGGQKQRVALARALINRPKVLLLDEPLGALDLKLRKELQVELLALQRSVGITFIFVTHDQEEALVLSDRIAVMRAGKIEQMGEAEALYERPRSRFVSQFLGSCNLLEGEISGEDAGEIRVSTPSGTMYVSRPAVDLPSGRKVTLAIRPEKVALASPGEAGTNRLPGTVEQLIYIGSETHYILATAGGRLTAYVMNSLLGPHGLEIGDRVTAHLPASALLVLED
ncbi:MAG: ABC transporter ATP-binding protein [Thermoanaerobaculia bacterium]